MHIHPNVRVLRLSHRRPDDVIALLRASLAVVATTVAVLAQATVDWYVTPTMANAELPVMTYDAARERVVLFAGPEFGTATGCSVWEWDGARWEGRNPRTVPQSGYAGFCYDPDRRVSVLFDGAGDTWLWDGHDWTLAAPAVRPPGRFGAGLAYDVARQRAVLFGGSSGGTPFRDTWEWDGTDWSRATPAVSPPSLSWFGMAYDAARQRTVAYGGSLGAPRDVWEWDGTNWSSVSPPVGPTPGVFDGLAYDPVRQRTVFVGFYGSWEWDGASWTQIPRGPALGGIAFDEARGETVVVGTSGLATWDGSSWTTRWSGAPAPPYAHHGGAVLSTDTARRRVFAFGGSVWSGTGGWNPVAQTRQWDGRTWSDLAPATVPPARFGHALFVDAARGRSVMFGGRTPTYTSGMSLLDDTWEWNGVDWAPLQPARRPSPRSDHGFAYDARRGRGVLFGGLVAGSGWNWVPVDETWEWDGATWLQPQPATRPSVRAKAAMAYDPARQRTVLFGGVDSGSAVVFADTWEWDGVTWRQAAPTTQPSPRFDAAMTWDPVRQQIVLFGGHDNSGVPLRDTWSWDGVGWSAITTTTTPPAGHRFASRPSMTFDPTRNALVVAVDVSATWLLGPYTRASSASSGSGCGGPGGAPTLAATEPRVGNDAFQLEVGHARPLAGCVVGIAPALGQTPLGGGCTLYVAGATASLAGTTNAYGGANLRIAIPADAALRGANLFAQAAVVDPAGPLSGIALSAALRLVLGD